MSPRPARSKPHTNFTLASLLAITLGGATALSNTRQSG